MSFRGKGALNIFLLLLPLQCVVVNGRANGGGLGGTLPQCDSISMCVHMCVNVADYINADSLCSKKDSL